jgi:predicted RNA-binding Zn ribbon-like protein
VIPGEDRSVALALVNSWHLTATGDIDHLDAAWLRDHELPDSADLGQLTGLRDAIRELFLAVIEERSPQRHALDAVNAAAMSAPAAPQLTWSTDGPRKHLQTSAALTRVAWNAIEMLSDHEPVRQCEAHGCVRLYLREHARRRWCSNGCGDRVRAMRHHHKQKPSS